MWSSPFTRRERINSKTFQLSPLLAIAYCGSARLGQILTFHMDELEDPPLGYDEMKWAVKSFIPHLRAVAEAHGHLHVHHNVEHVGESVFLFAVRDRLFVVEGDLQVGEGYYPYEAAGDGEEPAMGALRAALGDIRDPLPDDKLVEVAATAVEAAAEFTHFVGGQITTVKTERYTAAEKKLAQEILKR